MFALVASMIIASCFTPSTASCESLVVDQIDHANRTVLVQAYSFTNNAIAAALVRANARGVAVLVIADKSQRTERSTKIAALVRAGIRVMEDYKPAIAHNKVMIFDGSRVFTGSYNFTESAEHRNAENGILLDDPKAVAAFISNFASRKAESRAWNAAR